VTEDLRPTGSGGIEVQGVSRAFGARQVLRQISLTLQPGEIGAVVGENGSGKTSLLRILAGVLGADEGTVDVAGGAPGRGRASFIPAGDRMLNWRLTGRHNLEFFASLAGLQDPQRTIAVESSANAFGATALLEQRVAECSTGQRRRLMLAAGFIAGPPVVLLDEPYADLDAPGQADVAATCRRWADDGGSVVFAAPEAAEGPATDRILRLIDGNLSEVGGP
jgi:ABC-type multidrug transport system ATPase subunit